MVCRALYSLFYSAIPFRILGTHKATLPPFWCSTPRRWSNGVPFHCPYHPLRAGYSHRRSCASLAPTTSLGPPDARVRARLGHSLRATDGVPILVLGRRHGFFKHHSRRRHGVCHPLVRPGARICCDPWPSVVPSPILSKVATYADSNCIHTFDIKHACIYISRAILSSVQRNFCPFCVFRNNFCSCLASRQEFTQSS